MIRHQNQRLDGRQSPADGQLVPKPVRPDIVFVFFEFFSCIACYVVRRAGLPRGTAWAPFACDLGVDMAFRDRSSSRVDRLAGQKVRCHGAVKSRACVVTRSRRQQLLEAWAPD